MRDNIAVACNRNFLLLPADGQNIKCAVNMQSVEGGCLSVLGFLLFVSFNAVH